jgi:hypothetical protein
MASRAPTEMEAAMLKWLLIVLGIPFGIFLIVLGAMSAINVSTLQNQGRVVEATITQSQADQSNGWEIKYEFRVGGDATTYSSGDATGRKNLWVSVPQKPTANTVQVRYLPSDPWTNDLATANRMESDLTGLGAGVFFVLMGGLFLLSEIRNRQKKKAAQVRAVP